MSERRRDLGALWHVLGALALTLLVTVGGWVREKIQHPDGELSRHQKIEAGAWAVGALVAAAGTLAWVCLS